VCRLAATSALDEKRLCIAWKRALPSGDTARAVSPENIRREELVAGLIRVGELELTGDNEAEVDGYFAPGFVFHGPDGAQLDYEGLKAYFASMRAAFDDLTISRGTIIVEGDYVACQTTITGAFVREFTHSPVGPLPPNGRRVVFELMNVFRYDEVGRLAEEWVQTDNRSRLRQLGAEGR
jgi:predicted ester cyclase